MTTKKKNTIKIKTPLNFDYKTTSGYKFSKPSLTVPDETMTMRELVNRMKTGAPFPGVERDPIYLGPDGKGIDLRKLDLEERRQIINTAQQEIKALTEKITGLQERSTEISRIEEMKKREEIKKELRMEMMNQIEGHKPDPVEIQSKDN